MLRQNDYLGSSSGAFTKLIDLFDSPDSMRIISFPYFDEAQIYVAKSLIF